MITTTLKIIVIVCVCIIISLAFPSSAVNTEILHKHEMIPYATYNSCGGYIEAKRDLTIILEYKPEEEYDNDEFCVWEIRHAEGYGVLFTKTISDFEVGHDFLQFSGFVSVVGDAPPPNYIKKMGEITGMEQISMMSYVTFVTFSTDYSNTGTGFRLGLVGYGGWSEHRWYDDVFSFSPVGTTTLRPYFNDMTTTFVIAPKHKAVQSVGLEIEYLTEVQDYLTVYSLELNGGEIKFRQLGDRLAKNGTASFETSYYTVFVVFFFSDFSIVPQGGGVVLNWYIPDNNTARILT